jgi:hypothetical protein
MAGHGELAGEGGEGGRGEEQGGAAGYVGGGGAMGVTAMGKAADRLLPARQLCSCKLLGDVLLVREKRRKETRKRKGRKRRKRNKGKMWKFF